MAKKEWSAKTKEERKEEIDMLTQRIEIGIEEAVKGDNFQKYLKFMSSFHHYSFNNQMLIAMQYPDATLVKGYVDWKKQGRFVKQGEKAIKILAPVPYKVKIEDDASEEIRRKADDEGYIKKMAFKIQSVFDVSQTIGEELPQICNRLEFSVESFDLYYDAIVEIANCPIEFEDIESGANGYYSLIDNCIRIKSGMSEAHTIKTMLHELTHSILHSTEEGQKKPREVKETEAEGTANVICNYFGIPSDSYSYEYLASWGDGDTKRIRESLETIKSTSAYIIDRLEEILAEDVYGSDRHAEAV